MKSRVHLLGFCLLFVLASCQDRGAELRHEKLSKAIKSKDWSIRVRAIEELSQIAKDSVSVRELLVDHLFSDEVEPDIIDIEFRKVIKGLAESGPSEIESIIKKYEFFKPVPEKLGRLLFVLGRMGPKAKPATAFLLAQLEKHKGDPELEGAIRIVLANVGYESDENTARIVAHIHNRSAGGKAAVQTMTVTIPGKWVSREIAGELARWLEVEGDIYEWLWRSGDDSSCAATALAHLGAKNEAITRNLTKLIKYVWQDEFYCTLRITYGFSLIHLDPTKSDEALRDVLRYMGSEDFGNHTDFAALALVDCLIKPDIIRKVGEALDSKDREVVRGALWMLWFVGLDAREYAPQVLNILKQNPDEDLRVVAARAYAYVGDPSHIPVLKGILEKERGDFVPNEIIDAIRILRLQEEK
jgi:HEAT repeat protein